VKSETSLHISTNILEEHTLLKKQDYYIHGGVELNNILFVCLDSVRYDTFINADTPNMKMIGNVLNVHSFACWTIPSIIGYLLGWPPIGIGKNESTPEERKRFNLFPDHERLEWAPRWYKEKGYITAFLSGNACIQKLDMQLSGAISKWFNYFTLFEHVYEVAPQLNEIVNDNSGKPFFICILLLETHRPYDYGNGKKEIDFVNPEINLDNQKKAIEYIDSFFQKFIEILKKTHRTTTVIITSDHGDLVGPVYWSHDPSTSFLKFDEKLFQIPFIKGEVVADL